MRLHWFALILLLDAGCLHPSSLPGRHDDLLALSTPTGFVHPTASGALPAPPVARAVPAVAESTRLRFLALLTQGNLRGALEVWETHTGRTAPQAAWSMTAAFDKVNQVAGACMRVARSVHEGFKSLGFQPRFVRFVPPAEGEELLGWEMQAGVPGSTIQIADNAQHFAVKVGDRIYDAFTGPAGMKLGDYVERLHSPVGRPLVQFVETLP
jgi:hypothetical protein